MLGTSRVMQRRSSGQVFFWHGPQKTFTATFFSFAKLISAPLWMSRPENRHDRDVESGGDVPRSGVVGHHQVAPPDHFLERPQRSPRAGQVHRRMLHVAVDRVDNRSLPGALLMSTAALLVDETIRQLVVYT